MLHEDYWSMWVTHGEDWRKLFSHIDPGIHLFVEKLRASGVRVEESRYRWDAPDRSLTFPSPVGMGVWNKIDLLILGSPGTFRLRFSCAAWRDQEQGPRSPRRRFWCHSTPALQQHWEVNLEKDQDLLPKTVEHRLGEVYRTVTSWSLPPDSDKWKGEGFVVEAPATVP